MDIESCIKDLSPELQERARVCGSVKKLFAKSVVIDLDRGLSKEGNHVH